MSSGSRVFRKARLGLLLVLLLLAGAALVLVRLAPAWIESLAVEQLENNGFVVQAFPVESVSWSRTEVGRGEIGFQSHRLKWQDIEVTYRPSGIIDGKLERLVLHGADVEIDLQQEPLVAGMSALPESPEVTEAPGPVEAQPDPVPARPPTGDKAAASPPEGKQPVVKSQRQMPPLKGLLERLAEVPLDDLHFRDSRLRMALPGLAPLTFDGYTRLQKDTESMTCYGSLQGNLLGHETALQFRYDGALPSMDTFRFEGSILPAEAGQEPYLAGWVDRAGTRIQMQFASTPPLEWINRYIEAFFPVAAVFSGNSPQIKGNLSGEGVIFEGAFQVVVAGLDVVFPERFACKGISGDWDFLVRGLPKSRGIQELRIQSVDTSGLQLKNAQIRWALPALSMLRVQQAEAEMEGGRVSLEPFTVDPYDPEIRTRVHFDDLPGNSVFKWLGEERFFIEGLVSGSLGAVWQDGVLYIGDGILEMDTAKAVSRFVFSDPAFLEKQFSSLSDMPPELSEPLLEVLLEQGIHIESLSLELVPLREEQAVSLRLEVSGKAANEQIEVPIEGLVVNNIISEEDLGRLLDLLGPVRFLPGP